MEEVLGHSVSDYREFFFEECLKKILKNFSRWLTIISLIPTVTMMVLFILEHYGKQALPLPPAALFHVHDEPAGAGVEAARLGRKQRTRKA
jgi:hypothetical protein